MADPNDEATLAAEQTRGVATPGQVFAGRYRVERMLGRGAMGSVYAVHDVEVDERVALKVVNCGSSTEALARFRREVRLARRVTHRNAARTYDIGEHAGQHYLTMEFVDGESLERRLARQGRLSAAEVGELGMQLCHGLSAAHGVGVIHRDLKPANVLIESNGRVVITDFGVARGLQGDVEVTTNDLAVVGTPAYMAPEQVLSLAVDARADLYALGVMLFEMLAGVRPFVADNPMAVAAARVTDPAPDLRQYAELPDALVALVAECLHREPGRRPSSAHALAQRLAQATDQNPQPGAISTAKGSRSMPSAMPLRSARSLAVLPFRYRGPDDEAYLGDALSEELVDVLSMTRGLKVVGIGATAALAGNRDPKQVGERLGVQAVVEGTIHRGRDRVRVVARLLDVDNGFQLWTDRFEGALEDVFDVQDRVAKRVAEALRVQLEHQVDAERVPPEVAELYLRARAIGRTSDLTGQSLTEAFEMLSEALRRAPIFALALAQAADVAVRRAFLPGADAKHDWAAESKRAVEAALIGAPHLVDTHIAAARYSISRGEVVAAVRHLRNALDIAPTSAAALEYLGFLQCEAGQSEQGAQRILLAHELDPTANTHLVVVLRVYALQARWDDYETLLARLRGMPKVSQFLLDVLEVRVAGWRRDFARVRGIRPSLRMAEPGAADRMPDMLRSIYVGELAPEQAVAMLDALLETVDSPRFRATARQIAAEALAVLGRPAMAMAQVNKAMADGVLIDADWADRCPALEPIRGLPAFVEAREAIRGAADAIWRV